VPTLERRLPSAPSAQHLRGRSGEWFATPSENLEILTIQQLASPPLSDLLTANGGLDLETGGRTILLNFALRFFGRTLSGDEVDTAPARFTIEFTR
jgi:hypothetical protein